MSTGTVEALEKEDPVIFEIEDYDRGGGLKGSRLRIPDDVERAIVTKVTDRLGRTSS